MSATAANFFETFFRELEKRGIPFVILHDYEQLPEHMSSDIDFAVRDADLPRLLPLQREIAAQLGWKPISAVRANLAAQCAVFVDAEDPSRFIQLDACSHYTERGCFVFRDEELLGDRRRHRFFQVPAPAAEFGYRLAKSLLKGKPMATYLARLKILSEADPAGTALQFKKLVGLSLPEWWQKPAADWDRELRPRIRARTKFGPIHWLKEAGRALQRILRPAGWHLVILGPDGTGKSTLIANLGSGPCFRRQKRFHFRPNTFGKKGVESPVTQPHARPPRAGGLGALKLFYYFADNWLGYFLRVLPAKVRCELVIFDRSFDDILIDPTRYRLAHAGTLARALRKLLPRPDLIIVLDAEPELIHARKPELSIEELHRQRQALRELAAASSRYTLISAASLPEDVLRAVRQKMIEALAERQARWHS